MFCRYIAIGREDDSLCPTGYFNRTTVNCYDTDANYIVYPSVTKYEGNLKKGCYDREKDICVVGFCGVHRSVGRLLRVRTRWSRGDEKSWRPLASLYGR